MHIKCMPEKPIVPVPLTVLQFSAVFSGEGNQCQLILIAEFLKMENVILSGNLTQQSCVL